MRTVARLLALVSSMVSVLTLLPGLRGVAGTAKSIAGALSPITALLGGIGALLGLSVRDPAATAAGSLGAAVAARHIALTSRDHNGLEAVFGPEWEAGLDRSRWLRRRWSPLPVRIPRDCETEQGLVYAQVDGNALHCDVWQPPAGTPRSGLAVITVHGGAWHYGQRGGAMRPFCALLTGRGHTVIDIDYRLVPQAHFPGQVMDVKRAVAWVRQNVDADRIILYGGSAGAHLALMAAYAPEHPDLHPPELSPDTELCVDGIIAAYPPTDMSLFLADWERRQPRTGAVNRLQARIADYVVRQQGIVPEGGGYVPLEGILPSFFGGTPDAIPDVYRFGSPVEHVTRNAPPTLLIHGDDDHLVPVEHSLRLYDVLCEHGVPVVLTRYPQSGHAFDFFLVPISPPARSMMYDVERFLARLAAI